jgi:predicted benzoate:H+ symporter BenE
MFWDKLFWLWFLFGAIGMLYLLARSFSRENAILAFLLVGMGMLKLAEESRRGKGISRRLLEKLGR